MVIYVGFVSGSIAMVCLVFGLLLCWLVWVVCGCVWFWLCGHW